MEKLSDDFVKKRMGDPLETILQKDHKHMQKQKELSNILRKYWKKRLRTKRQRVREDNKIWDSIGIYNYSYGEAAYRLGYEDGVLGALDRVYFIIHNGIGCMLEFLGDDESDESITYILDEVDDTPERRAKMLLGEIPVKPD
ncbi:MAG: hypothetical protein HFH69_11460 [Lachnospiraceae bacterium]|nr:hypothetical protein [Lachnospiraceae bacterium]